jgi:uncharacterized protein DUF4082
MKKYILFCSLVFLGALSLNAESLRALSLSVANVQAAIDSAQSGDTVIVPAGDVTWSGGVTISKSLTLIGTGANITRASGNTNSLIAVKNLASDVPVRVSGFSFDNALVNKNGSQNTYDVAVNGSSTSHWTAIRFHKGSGNGGTHVGSLWSANGTLLSRVKFGNETSSGWQEAPFDTPVAVSAGVSYVASYFAPEGHYSITQNYFVAPKQNGIFCVPSNAGVYRYSSSPAFPTDTWKNSNYWLDVTLVP